MKAILILVAVLAAISSCAHKSEALQHAEATRRAEVHEADAREVEVKQAQKQEQKRFEKNPVAVDVSSSASLAAEADAARAAEVTLAPERLAFQRAARERLAALEAGTLSLSDRVATSTMPSQVRDETGKAAADLKSQIIALQGRLITVLEETPNASWSMTKESFSEQLSSLEDQLEQLDATL